MTINYWPPHHDEAKIDLNKLPGQGSTCSNHGVSVLQNHNLSVPREHVPGARQLTFLFTPLDRLCWSNHQQLGVCLPWRKGRTGNTTLCVTFNVQQCVPGWDCAAENECQMVWNEGKVLVLLMINQLRWSLQSGEDYYIHRPIREWENTSDPRTTSSSHHLHLTRGEIENLT